MMKNWADFDKTERRLISFAAAAMAICIYLLLFGDAFFENDVLGHGPAIGQIKFQQNDTRFRTNEGFAWNKAKMHQTIKMGDMVFSGAKSTAQIELKKGGELTVGENSLVVFREVKAFKMADLMGGNFRLKIEGNVKVAVNGTVTELEGTNSEVQIYVAKNTKPQVRLLRGEAKMKKKGKPAVKLDSRAIASIEVEPEIDTNPARKPIELPPPETKPETPNSPEIPEALTQTKLITYNWKLYDIYEQKSFQLFQRPDRPRMVEATAELSWGKSATGKGATISVASEKDFLRPLVFVTKQEKLLLHPIYLGENHWRVTFDQQNWSLPEKFEVQGKFIEDSEPVPDLTEARVPLTADKTVAPLKLTAPIETIGFVAEASTDETFSAGHTRTFWASSSEVRLSFYRPGNYFYRFRSVSKSQELSTWSKSVRFDVFEPPLPSAPTLASINKNVNVGELFEVRTNSSTNNKTFIELRDQSGSLVERHEGTRLRRIAKKAGLLYASALEQDEFGRLSPSSRSVKIVVSEKAPPPPTVVKKEAPKSRPEKFAEPVAKRLPASGIASRTALQRPLTLFTNERYKGTTVSLEGLLWTIQSSQQYYYQRESPIATGTGVKAIGWLGRSGLEGRFKVGVFGVNSAGQHTNLKDLEARYHYRFFSGFPYGLSRELQVSLFAGYEMYRNSGETFSGQYDLMKFGTSLEFPLGSLWSTGGEFVYGSGFEGSQKQEISGHLNYFLKPGWSLGCGYRLHYFQAGSRTSSPQGVLPYREGYTEGFSVLNYHF